MMDDFVSLDRISASICSEDRPVSLYSLLVGEWAVSWSLRVTRLEKHNHVPSRRVLNIPDRIITVRTNSIEPAAWSGNASATSR